MRHVVPLNVGTRPKGPKILRVLRRLNMAQSYQTFKSKFYTRRFESSHWQNLYEMFTVNGIKKTKIKKKRLGMAH